MADQLEMGSLPELPWEILATSPPHSHILETKSVCFQLALTLEQGTTPSIGSLLELPIKV